MRPIIGSPDGVADGDARAAFVLCIGFAAGRWVAGMTAPVRVHSGGRMGSAMGERVESLPLWNGETIRVPVNYRSVTSGA
ncbi:hypothetical protein SSPO_035770 [Streptomyces antimycoticus]|uniref:Uncharacterized protein n=1 Tax=Streptomyces antimycoticus TaxID=68175 RepID=A0A499UVP1_9ACTN|nr:hypothetical protein SSPO_035770 [Streptomyces antimycoticus]